MMLGYFSTHKGVNTTLWFM